MGEQYIHSAVRCKEEQQGRHTIDSEVQKTHNIVFHPDTAAADDGHGCSRNVDGSKEVLLVVPELHISHHVRNLI